MREGTKVNALRSGIVVVGALAFGYLTLQLGFRPFLERAQLAGHESEPSAAAAATEEEGRQPNSRSTRHF